MEREASITIRIDRTLRDTLAAIHDTFGMPISEQVRRALRHWLASAGAGKELAEQAETAEKSAEK